MNDYLIMKITKDLSDIIQKIKYCNKKYEETKKESYYNKKKKYILELALGFENLGHELDYKILYRFDKEALDVLENIADKCMTLYKIESTENKNIIDLNVKTENLTPYMINAVDNYFKNFEEGIKILTTTYPYKTSEEVNKILAVREMELKKMIGIEVDNDNNFDKVINQFPKNCEPNNLVLDQKYLITKKDTYSLITNKSTNITIKNKDNKLLSDNSNIVDSVTSMIEIAASKGWNLDKLKISGSDEFKKEFNKQLKEFQESQVKGINKDSTNELRALIESETQTKNKELQL